MRESPPVAVSKLSILLVTAAAAMLLAVPAFAQEEPDAGQLVEGQDLYMQNCSGCHQPSGAGLPGQIPPLLGNPNVDDAAYVTDVVSNGLSGPIEVNGESYDGVMPAFPTLDQSQIDSIIAFLQNDLTVPGEGDGGAEVPAGPVAGTSLPPVASALAQLGYLVAGVIAVLILGPRVVAAIGDRGEVSPVDAGLKTATIVVYFIIMTVIVPSLVLQTDVMARLPRGIQDFVASAIWFGALAIGVGGLWWAQRQDRI